MSTPQQWYDQQAIDQFVQTLQSGLDQKADATDLTNALAGLVSQTQRGAANGVAPLDASGKLPVANAPETLSVPSDGTFSFSLGSSTIVSYLKSKIDSLLGAYVPLSSKGGINGVASLDSTGKVPSTQLPAGSGGGSGDPYATLGYYNAGLTASTQTQATANGNAIATANRNALQAAINNCPVGQKILVPGVPSGQAYYLSGPVTVTRSNLGLVGTGTPALSDVSTSLDGGSCFKDVPGFSGAALFILDNCFRFSLDTILCTASTAKACVLDNGNGSIFKTAYLVGGTEAAYDSRNGNNAPYNLTLGANQTGHRANFDYCQVAGSSSSAGKYAAYFGVDTVIVGGRMNTGTKCLNGSGILMTGTHLTGGSPILDCQDVRNTVTGCQLDGASGVAMVRVNGSLTLNGCLFYQSSSPSPQIPLILNNGASGVRVNGGVVSMGGGSPAFTFLTQYVGSTAGAVSATVIRDLAGLGAGTVDSLWDGSGPPGKYSLYDGSVWHTDNNNGTR